MPLEQLLIGVCIAVEQKLCPVPVLALLAQLQPGALKRRHAGINTRIRQRQGHSSDDTEFC
jgi:hypothetical protein